MRNVYHASVIGGVVVDGSEWVILCVRPAHDSSCLYTAIKLSFTKSFPLQAEFETLKLPPTKQKQLPLFTDRLDLAPMSLVVKNGKWVLVDEGVTPVGEFTVLSQFFHGRDSYKDVVQLRKGYNDFISESRRRASREWDFGSMWGLHNPYDRPKWRLSFIEDTGELYAVELSLQKDLFILISRIFTLGEVSEILSDWASMITQKGLVPYLRNKGLIK